MGKRILHPEWRKENEPTKYPFGGNATLTNGVDIFIEGLFLDAIVYPIGGQARMYISKVELTHEDVTITVGDSSNSARATGTFDLINPPDRFKLVDIYGRPAGVIVSETLRLSTFQSWTIGEHLFSVDQTELAATVCVPTPEVGVRGILLDDGTLFTGDTYIVGDDGVALNTQIVEEPGPCGSAGIPVTVIRVDIVGDPLFRRRLCDPTALFATPRFIRTITFDDGKQQVKCGPNDVGDLKMTANNEMAEDTVLRIRMTDGGIVIRAEGTTLSGVR